MEEELLFKVVFIVVYGIFFVFRGYFRFYKVKKEPVRIKARDESPEYGKLAKIGISVLILGYLGSVMFYILIPGLIIWAHVPFPPIIRWVGSLIALLTIPLLTWIHLTLGKHFAADLVIQENHAIVTNGPYSRVRHPMYTVLLTFSMGMAMISANLLLIVFSIMLVVPFQFLTRQEEQMLLDGLGEDYKLYMERTGRFFPRLRQKK